MKISFSIAPWSSGNASDFECQVERLKACDLVFIPADMWPESIDKAKETLGEDKIVQLSSINNSRRILAYLKCKEVTNDRDRVELETIYQSLPKGIPLEIYSLHTFTGNKPPDIITLPPDED